MMQNNEKSNSFASNEVDQNQVNHEYLNLDANTNKQPAPVANPPKRQRKSRAAKKPDEQPTPQQNWPYAVSEPPKLPSVPSAFVRPMDYRPNHGHQNLGHPNLGQQAAHLHQFFNISSGPPQIPLQSQMQHQIQIMPYNAFNPYYPLSYVKYNQQPQLQNQYPQHHNQYPQHRVQPMQNMLPPTYQLNQNMPTSVTSDSHPSSSFTFTESDSQSRPTYYPTSPIAWKLDGEQAPNAATTLTALTDSQSLKHGSCGDENFQDCKRPRSLTSAGNDSTPSCSPYSAQSNDIKEECAPTAEKSVDDKNVLDPSHVIEEKYDFSCIICQEIRKDTVLFPCRHLCVCEKCSENIFTCPLCRKKFHETLTVYT